MASAASFRSGSWALRRLPNSTLGRSKPVVLRSLTCTLFRTNNDGIPRRRQHTRGSNAETNRVSGKNLESSVDESDEDHEMTIYHGILSTQIRLVKSFSLMTSAIGVSCQPLLYYKITEANANLAAIVAGGAFFSFFTLATPLLIHWVSKKYVTEMLYNKIDNTYTAITYSLLLRRKKITFTLEDVKVPDIPGMFTTFRVSGTALFVDGSNFASPQHYGKIMGYDKPLNLRWEGDHTESHARALKKTSR